MADLNRIRTEPGRDLISRGNSGETGLFNENTGMINQTRVLPQTSLSIRQPVYQNESPINQAVVKNALSLNSRLSGGLQQPIGQVERFTQVLTPVNGVPGANFTDGSRQFVNYQGRTMPVQEFWSMVRPSSGFEVRQQPVGVVNNQSVNPVVNSALSQISSQPIDNGMVLNWLMSMLRRGRI